MFKEVSQVEGNVSGYLELQRKKRPEMEINLWEIQGFFLTS